MQQYLRHRNDGERERKPPLSLPLRKKAEIRPEWLGCGGYSPPPVYLMVSHGVPECRAGDNRSTMKRLKPTIRTTICATDLWANFLAVRELGYGAQRGAWGKRVWSRTTELGCCVPGCSMRANIMITCNENVWHQTWWVWGSNRTLHGVIVQDLEGGMQLRYFIRIKIYQGASRLLCWGVSTWVTHE